MQEQTFRPSKQFIIRGSIAIGIVAIVLLVQTQWFKNLFHLQQKKAPAPQTVGELITGDTNKNGIPDWEEKLWGLDPTVLYTNGIPNKQIIEEKKKALGIKDIPEEELNDTDRLARQLYSLSAALGQSDVVDDKTLETIMAKLSESIDIKEVQNNYALKDITTVQTTTGSLRTYYKTMTTVITKYRKDTADIDIIVAALETGDPSRLPELAQSAALYKSFAKEISTVKVPIGVAQYHLSIMNSFNGIGQSFSYLEQLNDNAVASLVGIAMYNTYNARLGTAVANMENYLTRYGILSS